VRVCVCVHACVHNFIQSARLSVSPKFYSVDCNHIWCDKMLG